MGEGEVAGIWKAGVVVEHSRCRACGGELTEVYDLGLQHLSEFTDKGEPRHFPPVPLTLMLCRACTLVQLKHTTPREWLYRRYWYRSGTNESMVKALQEIVARARELVKLEEWDWVMDIGANDGTLLKAYALRFHPGRSPVPQRIGFDPAMNLQSDLSSSCEMMIPDYFPAVQYDGPKCKIITSIAMLYDLEDPQRFVAEIARVLHPEGVWIVQLGDLVGMLASNGFDAICHEHLEYYSVTSLVRLLEAHDLVIADLERNQVNGGSVRLFVRHRSYHPVLGGAAEDALKVEKLLGIGGELVYQLFRARVTAIKEEVVAKVVETPGDVDVYGASTKGNTLLQTLGLDGQIVRQAWERAPEKWGKWWTGGIPVVSEEEGRKNPPALLLVLPWHFRKGILEREGAYRAGGGKMLFPLPVPEEL